MTRDFETHPGIFTVKPEWLTIKHQDFSKYRHQILGMWVMDDSPYNFKRGCGELWSYELKRRTQNMSHLQKAIIGLYHVVSLISNIL